jgi:hypothetical protein
MPSPAALLYLCQNNSGIIIIYFGIYEKLRELVYSRRPTLKRGLGFLCLLAIYL